MLELRAEARDIAGKAVKTLRQKGVLPAVLYGYGIENLALTAVLRDFERVYNESGESTLIRLAVGDKTHSVLIHDVAYDPVSGHPIHADFYAVRMDRPIRASIQLEFTGESGAVKNEGGILVKVMHQVEVEALPADLPHNLRVDLSLLESFDSRILVGDIAISPDVRLISHAEETVAIVERPRSEEELAALEQAPEAEPAAVKTVREMEQEAAEKDKEDAEAPEGKDKK